MSVEIGSTENDFLPLEFHGQAVAAALGEAQTLLLSEGEGHFVYLNE